MWKTCAQPASVCFTDPVPQPIPPSVGQLVRLRREERAWTQDRLAQAAGISMVTVQRLEQRTERTPDARPIKRATLMQIMAALHRARPLSEADFDVLLSGSATDLIDRVKLEEAVRSMAGEFDGLKERVEARGRQLGDANIEKIAAMQPTEAFYVQAIVAELCARYPIPRVFTGVLALKAQLEEEAANAVRSIPATHPPSPPLLKKPIDAGVTELHDPHARPANPPARTKPRKHG